jgi:hypothetical protein
MRMFIGAIGLLLLIILSVILGIVYTILFDMVIAGVYILLWITGD